MELLKSNDCFFQLVIVALAMVASAHCRMFTYVRPVDAEPAATNHRAQPRLGFEHHHISEDEHVDYYVSEILSCFLYCKCK